MDSMPLPPYITHQLEDKDRYQTVYAKHERIGGSSHGGASFHARAAGGDRGRKGWRSPSVTLHVGLGTFRPVKVENVLEHHMHSEFYMIEENEAAEDQPGKSKWRAGDLCGNHKLPDH